MRLETLAPEYWFLLLLAAPVLYFALRTYAEASRFRKITIAVLRVAVLVMLVVALVRARLWRSADESSLCVMAMVDVSESMPREKTLEAAKEIAALSANAAEDHQYGMLVFAGRCQVCIPPSAKPITEDTAKGFIQAALDAKNGSKEFQQLERNETRYDQALELASSIFPSGLGKRVVIWTDGNETDGASLTLASRLKQNGVDLNIRTVETKDRPLDVLVASLNVPTQVRTQEAFDVNVSLMATREAKGKVLLYRSGFLVGSRDVTIPAEGKTEAFRQSIIESGQYVYRAVFETNEAQSKDNDEAYAYMTAAGAPRILVIGVHELESSRLIEALRATKAFVEYRDSYGSPQALLELFGYDGVVVNNVPSSKLSENQMRMLRDYVKDFGGAVVAIGGQRSLTVGDYAGTPLEDILPVSCSTEGLPAPSLSVALVIDTSRSLTTQRTADGKPFDAPAFVRQITNAVAARLSPNDFFGVVCTGNEKYAPRWMVRMQKVFDRDRIKEDIDRELATNAAFGMRSNVYNSIRRAAEELNQQDTRRKQIVVISDGFFESGYSYPRLAAKLNADHVQVSTVPVGPQADNAALQEIARWGGGLCLEGDSSSMIDTIRLLFDGSQAPAMSEDPFRVRKVVDSPLIESEAISTAPMLFGYVRTRLKTGATNILAVPPEYDPLLATWEVGEGRSTVFTSDVKDKWSVLWAREWGRNFEGFWNGVVLNTARRSDAIKLIPRLRVSGQLVSASLDMLDSKDHFVSGKSVHGEIYYLGEQGCIYTRSNMERFELTPSGPGKYIGTHRINRKGLYAVKFRGPERGQVAATGIVVSNFREYLTLSADKKQAGDLCDAGGGKLDADIATLASLSGKTRETMTDLGHWAVLAACLLFLADVCARRWPAITRVFRGRAAR